jgi:hypothetical protein
MGDPGNPTDPSGTPGNEPDPAQPGWASPTPPATPPTPPPTPPSAAPSPPPAYAPPAFTPPPPPPGTPGGGPVDPAGWEPPPTPVKKRRLTWLWILIPVLLVCATSVIVIAVFAIRAIVGPIEATDDYFAALRDERYAAAYDLRCTSFQAQITEADFTTREQQNGPVRDFDIDSFDTNDDTATTEGEVTRSGIKYDVTVHLEKEGDDWKVCEIEARR